MVDAIRKPSTQPLPKRAAGAPQPAPPAPEATGPARDRLVVSAEAQREADKAERALGLLGQDDPNAPKHTTVPVELVSHDKQTATWSSRAQQLEDKATVVERRALERAKLDTLGPERAKDYEKVRSLIQHDPSAELALQTMLLNERTPQLTGAPDLDGKGDVLMHLAAIATQPNAHGVKTAELLRTFTRELANPKAISQGDGDIGTCVATTATIAAATANPAEIARLVAGLASAEGRVTLHRLPGDASAPVLARPANWNKDTHGFGGDRSPSVRLLQPALMNYALATALDARREDLDKLGVSPEDVHVAFDPRTDAYTPSGGADTALNGGRAIAVWKELNSGGLDTQQGNRLLEHLTGKRFAPLDVNDANRDEAFGRIREAVVAGHMVPVGVDYKEKHDDGTWSGGGHQMMIEKIDAKGVHVIDPIEGTHHVWSEAKVKGAVTDANLPLD